MRRRTQPGSKPGDLSRSVGGKVLVAGVSIKVAPGELVAIVGPSGAGKSSFLRLVNRLDEPTGGTVILDGTDYHTIPPRELRRRVGMVMQMAYLFPGTVAANIAFGPRQRGEQTDAGADRGAAGARRSPRLWAARRQPFVGRRGATRFGRPRLANAPEALLLDEPTSALDETSARGVEQLIVDLVRERRMACLIVTTMKRRRFGLPRAR